MKKRMKLPMEEQAEKPNEKPIFKDPDFEETPMSGHYGDTNMVGIRGVLNSSSSDVGHRNYDDPNNHKSDRGGAKAIIIVLCVLVVIGIVATVFDALDVWSLLFER